MQEYAMRIAAAEERDVARVSEERKKRNYADFWVGHGCYALLPLARS